MDLKKQIKERLEKLEIRPSKGLGQNFLVSENAYEKIIKAVEIERGEQVVEIGPGLGTLTKYLATAGAQVTAVEKDRKLISFLETEFKDQKVKIIEGDALIIDPADLGILENNYKIAANIPYYITSRLIRNILELWPRPKLVIILVQREVAERIIAKPPHMNLLAISVQYFSEPKIISMVPRGSFYPMPKVDSAIIKLVPRAQKLGHNEEIKQIFRIVKIGFASKRKKLLNNLSTGLKIDKKEVESTLIKLSIDPKVRPENLTISQWHELAKNLD